MDAARWIAAAYGIVATPGAQAVDTLAAAHGAATAHGIAAAAAAHGLAPAVAGHAIRTGHRAMQALAAQSM